ncbi:MAG: hypothetical protein A3J38_08440 [Gammaproteobacteria bacterium RIFCSPHIGHO2_12_FULL_45_9]|nr:MAG: hypothetical protein A3J38_08440 [Gammaproteobacteria bacterium RIFCSPHIGHO2_12_FULL_45_9]
MAGVILMEFVGFMIILLGLLMVLLGISAYFEEQHALEDGVFTAVNYAALMSSPFSNVGVIQQVAMYGSLSPNVPLLTEAWKLPGAILQVNQQAGAVSQLKMVQVMGILPLQFCGMTVPMNWLMLHATYTRPYLGGAYAASVQ